MLDFKKKLFKSWAVLKEILKETFDAAYTSNPYRILGSYYDHATGQTIFNLKQKRVATTISLSAKELLEEKSYFISLSKKDREKIIDQYLQEKSRPKAYIEEYPIDFKPEAKPIFKIFLLDEGRLVCGTAGYFFEEAKEVVYKLPPEDIVRLTLGYYREKFKLAEDVGDATCLGKKPFKDNIVSIG